MEFALARFLRAARYVATSYAALSDGLGVSDGVSLDASACSLVFFGGEGLIDFISLPPVVAARSWGT